MFARTRRFLVSFLAATSVGGVLRAQYSSQNSAQPNDAPYSDVQPMDHQYRGRGSNWGDDMGDGWRNGGGANNTGPVQNGGYPRQYDQSGIAGSCQTSRVDVSTAQPKQSQLYRFMQPQGWVVAEQPSFCLVASPDMTMAYGVMAPGMAQGRMNAEQYMRDALTRLGQLQNIQVMQANPMRPQQPFAEAASFVIAYQFNGKQFHGFINCAVAPQSNGGTYGFMQLVLATPDQMQANGQALVQLLQSVSPMSPDAGQTPNYGGNGAPNTGRNLTPNPGNYPAPQTGPVGGGAYSPEPTTADYRS